MKKSETTRLSILQQAFDLMYKKGYQATSIDDILAGLNITKGAFFYHFKSKDEMGEAMMREIMRPGMELAMIEPLNSSQEPLAAIYRMMENLLLHAPVFDVQFGCPAINLIEEMAPVNNRFKAILKSLSDSWRAALVNCLESGKTAGLVKQSTDAEQMAVQVISGYGGIRNLGKLMGRSCYETYLGGFRSYLATLHA